MHDRKLGSPPFHFFMAVWGDSYINSLLDVALPALLAQGNLPAFYDHPNTQFVFITSPLDEPVLRSASIVQNLSNFFDVTYITFDPSQFAHAHLALHAAHRLAAEKAAEERAKVIVLCPDMILSSGSLARVRRHAEEGRRAVLVPGLRLATETAMEPLRRALSDLDPEILIPRTLMRFAMDHLHPQTKRFFVDSSGFTGHPVMCIWPMGPSGLLVRGFHLHPLLVDFSREVSLERLYVDTIDGSFLGHSVGNWADIRVEEDSDDLLLFTLTPLHERSEPARARKFTYGFVRSFAYSFYVNPLHRKFFTHALKLHTCDLDDAWVRKVEETGLAAFDILHVQGDVRLPQPLAQETPADAPPPTVTHGHQPSFRLPLLTLLRALLKKLGIWPIIQRIRRWSAHKYFHAGLLATGRGNFTEAEEWYRHAIVITPDAAEIFVALGNTLIGAGRATEAITALRKALALQPNGFAASEIYVTLGHAMIGDGRAADAITAFQKALELHPSRADAVEIYTALGHMLRDAGRTADAITAFREALALHPSKPDAAEICVVLGNTLIGAGHAMDAIMAFREALALRPSGPAAAETYVALGRALIGAGHATDAIPAFKKALELHPSRPDAAELYIALGNMLTSAGRATEAITAFREALALYPSRPDAAKTYVALGNALIGAGRATESITVFREALALHPSHEMSYSLGMALLSAELHDEAIDVLQNLTAVFPDRKEIWLCLGSAYHLSGRIHEATEVWGAGMAVQERLARSKGLATNVRYLSEPWIMGIGHLALLDFFAKRQILGVSPVDRYIVLAVGKIANPAYLALWREHFEIISTPSRVAAIAPDARLLEDFPTVLFIEREWRWLHNAYAIIEDRWEAAGRGPLLRLTANQITRGRSAMAKRGLPDDAWFVTLHTRAVAKGTSLAEDVRTGRNAAILDYQQAIRRITDVGGWVVRIGGPDTTPLPKMERVIDYAHCSNKHDWLDVFLISQCRFFLGTNSGPVWVAKTFGVPTLLTNWAPIAIQSHASNSVMLPRLVRSNVDGRLLSFAEQLEPPIGHTEAPRRLQRAGVSTVPNTPEEIATATVEMIQRAAGCYIPAEGDGDRQRRFRDLVTDSGMMGRGKVAAGFLSQHAELL